MNVESVLPRDAIPSIDDPAFGRAYFGGPDDEVIVLDGDPPLAFPIRVLSYHEVVNVADPPVAVTWCPICWSAAVYHRRVDGRTLTFGVSGDLADDALVLYDRETDSRWRQPSGECLDGPLAGRRLDARPYAVRTAGSFREAEPDGQFLQPVRGGPDATDADLRAIHDMDRYEAYVEGDAFGLYGMRGTGERRTWDREDLGAKTLVLGVERGDAAVGYPLPGVLDAGGVVTDTVGDIDVVVFAVAGRLHAFEDPGLSFGPTDEPGRFRADGTTWDGETGAGGDGRTLARVPARSMFAFAWQDDHGPGSFYGLSG